MAAGFAFVSGAGAGVSVGGAAGFPVAEVPSGKPSVDAVAMSNCRELFQVRGLQDTKADRMRGDVVVSVAMKAWS